MRLAFRVLALSITASLGALVLLSCSRFEGVSPDLESEEASAPSSPRREAGSGVDGAGASADADAGCPGAAFCDDFERDGPVQGAWTNFDLGPKDTAKIETTSAPGLTRALHVVVGASAPNERHAVLQRWFVPGAATTLMARFAFRTSDTTRHMNLANLLLRDTPKTPEHNESVALYFEDDQLKLIGAVRSGDSYDFDPKLVAPAPSVGAWHTVVETLDFSAPAPVIDVDVDGVRVYDHVALQTFSTHDAAAFIMGVDYALDDERVVDLWYDDVRVELR